MGRTSYLNEHCPDAIPWIVKFNQWLAQYPYTVNKNGDLGEWIYTCDRQLAS